MEREDIPGGDAGIGVAASWELAEKIAGLERRRVGETIPHPRPERWPLKEICQMPDVFQPRGSEGLDERHISELRRGFRVHGKLDPVEVLWIGAVPYLIDGHHRMAAFAGEGVDVVPIKAFGGTVGEAVLRAGHANSKTHLPMSTQGRNDYAWRLVRLGGYSKAKIVEASGVSDGQVATMRRALKALGEEAFGIDRWWQVRDALKGRTIVFSEEDHEAWLEQQAGEWADKMAGTFSTKLSANPTLAARAFHLYFGRNLPHLVRELEGYLSEDDLTESLDF